MADDNYKDCPNYLEFGPLEQRVCSMEKRVVEDREYGQETRRTVDGVKATIQKVGGGIAVLIVVIRLIPFIVEQLK